MKVRITDLLDDYADSSVKLSKPDFSCGRAVKDRVLAEVGCKMVRRPPKALLAAACFLVIVSCGAALLLLGGREQGASVAPSRESFGIAPPSAPVSEGPEAAESLEEAVIPEEEEAESVIQQMWEAGRFDLDSAVVKTDQVYGLSMAVPEEYAEDLSCNNGEYTVFKFTDGVTKAQMEYAGNVFWLDVFDRTTFYEDNGLMEGSWARIMDPNCYMLARTEEYVILVRLPTDVQYDPNSQQGWDSYRNHKLTSYVMMKDFLERNDIEENPDWEEDYCEMISGALRESLEPPRYTHGDWEPLELSFREETNALTWSYGGKDYAYALPMDLEGLSEKERWLYLDVVDGASYGGRFYLFLPGLREGEPGMLAVDIGEGEFWYEREVQTPDYASLSQTRLGTDGVGRYWVFCQGTLGAGLTESSLYISTDGGVNWQERKLQEAGIEPRVLDYIDFLDDNEGFLSVGSGVNGPMPYIYVTWDGGATWSPCKVDWVPEGEVALSVQNIARTEEGLTMTILVDGTGNLKKLYSMDEGQSWSETKPKLPEEEGTVENSDRLTTES